MNFILFYSLIGVLAKAAEMDIGEGLTDSLLPTEDFVVEIGSGIKCIINGHSVSIGNRRSLESNSTLISDGTFEAMEFCETKGQTAICVSIDGRSEAVVGLIDKAREESSLVIKTFLQNMGIKTFMLTGDNERTARVVASEIGIPPTHVISDVLPEGKVDCIKRLQDLGERVAMIGDGVNDSPAMAQADVGIAIGAGTDVAIETSGIVLINSKLTDALVAIDLSKKVFDRIRLNFIWALGYNTMAIPIAAGALYPVFHTALPPFMAAVSMIMSSLSVLVSSLLLNLYKAKDYDNKDDNQDKMSSGTPSIILKGTQSRDVMIYNSSEVSNMCQSMKEGKSCSCSPDSCACNGCACNNSRPNLCGDGTSTSADIENTELIYPGCGQLWQKECSCVVCKCGISCSTKNGLHNSGELMVEKGHID